MSACVVAAAFFNFNFVKKNSNNGHNTTTAIMPTKKVSAGMKLQKLFLQFF
jgi:hypothetical protein